MRPTPVLVLLAALTSGLVACDRATARSSAGGDGSAETAAAAAPSMLAQGASIDLGFTLGQPDAPIAVVEFSDFGCPYCARFARATLPTLIEEYVDTGRARWRYVPIAFGFPGGQLMGSAAVCAVDQAGEEVFWEVHDLFYTRQAALREPDARPHLLDWLEELGLDRDALDACIDAPETEALLRTHTQTAVNWYVRGTPTFLVNGVPMAGAVPVEFFRKVFGTVLDPSGL